MQLFEEYLAEHNMLEAAGAAQKLRLSGLLKLAQQGMLDTTRIGDMYQLFRQIMGVIPTRAANPSDPKFFDKLRKMCCDNIFDYKAPEDPDGVIAAWLKRNPQE